MAFDTLYPIYLHDKEITRVGYHVLNTFAEKYYASGGKMSELLHNYKISLIYKPDGQTLESLVFIDERYLNLFMLQLE